MDELNREASEIQKSVPQKLGRCICIVSMWSEKASKIITNES